MTNFSFNECTHDFIKIASNLIDCKSVDCGASPENKKWYPRKLKCLLRLVVRSARTSRWAADDVSMMTRHAVPRTIAAITQG